MCEEFDIHQPFNSIYKPSTNLQTITRRSATLHKLVIYLSGGSMTNMCYNEIIERLIFMDIRKASPDLFAFIKKKINCDTISIQELKQTMKITKTKVGKSFRSY